MEIVCLLGCDCREKEQEIANILTKFGFRQILECTAFKNTNTNKELLDKHSTETIGHKLVDIKKFDSLKSKGMFIETEVIGDVYYGTVLPFGGTKYVAIVSKNVYKSLKEQYGNQVVSVIVHDNYKSSDNLQDTGLVDRARNSDGLDGFYADIDTQSSDDLFLIVSKILQFIKNKDERIEN